MRDHDKTFRLNCCVDECGCNEFDPDDSGRTCSKYKCGHRAAKHMIKPEDSQPGNDFVTRRWEQVGQSSRSDIGCNVLLSGSVTYLDSC